VSSIKTTIDIADSLLLEAKARAARDGTTLRALVEEGLRTVLGAPTTASFSLRDASVAGEGLTDEFRGASWEGVREAIYEERGG
jgi:Arc/MetJ family transcription regulator